MKTLHLKPYPSYKPSGVEWLGDVPAHWEVKKLRSILTEVTERNQPDWPLLSVVRERGVILRDVTGMDENHNFIPDDLTNYKVVHKGQFAMNKMKAWQGSYGVSKHDGIVSPAYFTFDISDVTGDYFHVAVRSKIYVPFFSQASDGVRIGQWDLSQVRMREIPCLVPPLAEQNAIVRYLNQADERIRRYVSSRERLIELLEEYRQAVIQHAVTRGVDPDVRLKPSGVEWLGDVPAHWEVLPLKHWLGMNEVVLSETTDPNFEFRYIDIGSVGTGVLIEKPQKIRFATAPSRARRIVRDGDTIISTVRTYLKAVWFAEDTKDNFICSTGFAVLTPRQGTLPKFVSYLTQNNSFIDRVTANSVGIAYPAITESRLGSFQVVVPPFSEQVAIVAYLDKTTADIDIAINRARREIELLGEYRTRLIADVVTGKVDVREAVADLPDDGMYRRLIFDEIERV